MLVHRNDRHKAYASINNALEVQTLTYQSRLPTTTGVPDWKRAREIAQFLLNLPSGAAEEEIRTRLHELLGRLFPKLTYPEIAIQSPTTDGPADIVCRNLVIETKVEGKLDASRIQPDGSTETPEQQLERYLTALSSAPEMFYKPADGWRGLVTDGRRWDFYSFNPASALGSRLVHLQTLYLNSESDVDLLILELQSAVDAVSKIAPPTHDSTWANENIKGFINLAT